MPELVTRPEADPQDDEDFAFLGREFLTWLLWRAERGEDSFGAREKFTLSFGGRVRLTGAGGDVTDAILKGRSAAMGVETRAAVGAGRTLREAELSLSDPAGDREWRFTLVADTLDLKGVRLPAVLGEDEPAGELDALPGERRPRSRKKAASRDVELDPLAERMALLEELDQRIGEAFAEFLRDRTRPAWQRSIVPGIRTWLAEGLRVK
jgi:hypothetical protein